MNTEVNKLVMRAVTDVSFREEFLNNPIETAKKAGTSAAGIKALERVNMVGLQKTLASLSTTLVDIVNPVAAGHSRDWSDSNIHDKDDHIHDKNHTSLTAATLVSNPSDLDVTALREALKDNVVRREFMSNPKLRSFIETNNL